MLRLQNMIFRILPSKAFGDTGLDKKAVISLCNSMMELNFTENLRDIHCRTLVLCGEKDKSNLDAALKLKAYIKNAEMTLIPNAGHEINIDSPVQLGKTVNVFCSG